MLHNFFFALSHSPVFLGALSGFLSAVAVDYQAFLRWKSAHDAATYSWGTALWRWFQGMVAGAAGAAGLFALTS